MNSRGPRPLAQVAPVRLRLDDERIRDAGADPADVIKLLVSIADEVSTLTASVRKYQRYMVLLRMPEAQFEELEQMIEDLKCVYCDTVCVHLQLCHAAAVNHRLKTALWEGIKTWRASRAVLDETEYVVIDVDAVGKEVRARVAVAASPTPTF